MYVNRKWCLFPYTVPSWRHQICIVSVLGSVFTLIETIFRKICAQPLLKIAKRPRKTFTSFLIAWQKIKVAFLTINTLMLHYSYIKVSCRRNRRHSCLFMSVLPKVKYFLLCCISETGTTRLTNEIELYSIFNHVNHGKVKSLRVFFLNWCADTPGAPYAIRASDAGRCEPRLQQNNKYKPVAVSDISRDTLKGFIRR